ncbi:MAG: tRNA (N(6)-L-threonylcarbamoyladenosine(37)-C(2))-methylthiotransferase MtaB [Alphaproteobacteria bacterium]|nr:tRNA (N(6)-L-threonylcarbamoyladenosine(37)-C(2))-methylthiotransferase MtaB [Alphaproteobacteria bacterium]
MTVDVINFGCRLNIYEGEVIKQQAASAGLANALIFNGCAVTAEAERQLRQAIRKARKESPEAKIIVTGCAAQIHPETYAAMGEVDVVLGNEEKLQKNIYSSLRGAEGDAAIQIENKKDGLLPPQQVRGRNDGETQSVDFVGDTSKIFVNDIMSVKETASHMVASFEGKARAFVQVQNGCDHRCTFCIIPYGRGNSRSVPMGEVVSQVRSLAAAGYNEVVLTGVDVSDYGKDLPGAPSLGQMMKRLLALVPELPRLRLSSIDAVEVDADLFALIKNEPRLMPHIHISLQAGDDMILKRMKRRHNRADIVEFCERVKKARPEVVFGADIIAGFPTETDEMFENTLRLVEEVGLTYLHVFPYSARSGTPAAKMPQVPLAIRKERAARLRAAGEKQLEKYLQSRIGKTECIVMEKPRLGRSEGFAMVEVDAECEVGSMVSAEIDAVTPHLLRGRVFSQQELDSRLRGNDKAL